MLSEADEQQIVRAIGNAERGNRGEVRVHIERRCPLRDPVARARVLFVGLGLHKTRDDTGVLLYIAERSRRTAVFSGTGIYDKADATFWQGVSDAVARGFARGEPAAGICEALGEIGNLLRVHVGGEDEAGDEVPNRITTGADARDPQA